MTGKISFFDAEPELYEKTFGYRDFKTQVRFLDKIFKKNNSKKILDIVCGYSPQGRMLSKKKYFLAGIDLAKGLLKLGEKKAKKEKVNMKFHEMDMTNFKLGNFDAAYIMFNSLLHLNSKEKPLSHFKSVNNNLKKGGIYIVDLSQSPFDEPFKKHKIDRRIKGIKSIITYIPLSKKNLTARFQIETHYKDKKYLDSFKVLMFLPLEALKSIAKKTGFEIGALYKDFNSTKLKKNNAITSIAVLRKVK